MCLVAVATACAGPVVPENADMFGRWEKQDDVLPPINLELLSSGNSMVARLRLSGSNLVGRASVERDLLRLRFPERPEMTGRFVSKTELTLRLNASGPDYTLIKQGR